MYRSKTVREITIAVIAVLGAAAACYPFAAWLGHHSVALLLLLVVSVLAMRLGLTAVMIAAILSAMVWDFFFIPPYFTFTIDSGEDVLLLLMYFVVASLNGVINYRLRQLNRLQKEKSEREKALHLYNTIFSSLSHELKTPIAAILGSVDVLTENNRQLSAEQKQDLVLEIEKGALRLSAHVEDLLNISRLDAGVIQAKKEWCEIRDVLHQAIQNAQKYPETRPVRQHIPEGLPLMRVDFGLTAQIIQNLLANAMRHTPTGTTIEIGLTLVSNRRGHFESLPGEEHFHAVNDGVSHTLIIRVWDNGPGISEKDLPYIFNKFYRSKDVASEGAGLGLYIAKGFTEAQEGDISVHNLPAGGACFVVELPTQTLSQINTNV